MSVLSRSLFCIVLFASAVLFAQQKAPNSAYYDFLQKTNRTVYDSSSQLYDKVDFIRTFQTGSRVEKTQGHRLIRAMAAGKFVEKHFAGKVVVPVFFNSDLDPLGEKEMLTFLENAPSAVVKGPIYVTTADNLLPIPDAHPTLEQIDVAMTKGIELHADVLVSFIGFPENIQDVKKMACWQWNENMPRLIFTDLSGSFLLKRSLIPCPVSAAIIRRPFPLEEEKQPWYSFLQFWKEKPKTLDPFFKYYVLLSEETADELQKNEEVFFIREK